MIYLSIPTVHILKTKWNEKEINNQIPKGFTNDASQLNLTKIDTIIQVPNNKKEIEIQLKNVLKYAKENNLKISIAGAKHSMGGHTIYPNGILLNMLPHKEMKLDTKNNILTIGSGALWEDALLYLDKKGKSIAIRINKCKWTWLAKRFTTYFFKCNFFHFNERKWCDYKL
ncbi:FAD-binding protein [Algoriella sp.]|uniref:FAD-binding protein n=1 Tax=Algoriella sp. TaxID=1872434 RepID=UPI002FC640DC